MGNSLIKGTSGKDEIDIKEWVVVKGPAGGFLGKPVMGLAGTEEQEGKGSASWKQAIIDAISQGDCVKLDPVLEFLCPLRPVQDPRTKEMIFSRDPVIVSVDFILSDGCPLYVKAASVYFCADLQGHDAATYKSFVEQATASAMKNRAGRAGLELVHSLPPTRKE